MESLATLPRPEFVPVTSAERLEWALDDALDTDLDDRFEAEEYDTGLGAELEELQRQKARLAALEARMIARWDARQAWAADGSKSASAALAGDAGLSPGTAKALVARARKLRSMPATAKALANGQISVDHVDLLTRANQEWRDTRFTAHEQMLVQQCTRLRYPQARQAISYWCQRADADAAEEAGRRIDHRRYATTATTLDGEVVVNAVLDPVGGTAFDDEVQRLEHLLYLDDQKCGNKRTIRQRRADALVEMANRSRTSPAGGLRPRPLITILVGEQSFRRTCELAAGTVITPGQLVPYLAEADIERITFEGRDRVLGVSRRRRFIGALRRAIEVRDRHCQHTRAAATNRRRNATSITSRPAAKADPPARSTDACCAPPTTATPTNETRAPATDANDDHPRRHRRRPSVESRWVLTSHPRYVRPGASAR